MPIKCCKPCKPPDRHPGCHDHCKKYIDEKARYEKDTAEKKQKMQIYAGITEQKYDGVRRAYRRKGKK